MKINEILTEESGIDYDTMGRPYFKTHKHYLDALNSKSGWKQKAAADVTARGEQEGWPENWNASSTQDQYASQLTMPPGPPKTILDPNRAGLNIADISKQSQLPVAGPKVPVPAVPFKSSIKPIKYSPAIRSRRQ